ncbi:MULTISPECIES: hypothetical protein [unclassified Pseudomonas]|uniref:hypothetical protein n=1 Tax=unclassified Pseudomonas TaxID=196821 RepID=UPI00159FB814|nr:MULTISPECIES: hypothetical protein [unclassified Pseudomonas]MBT1270499.1 hypothetical protein [Pseudomonas sp. VS38]NVZ17767.1 hypothetical protein [Pseudomonas sp. IPO3775]NWA80066.1 hypothetical protein [Pseudomonas sp. C8002]NWB62951.1 hypothetical protein [Pseudomonas sp. F1002]NWC05223.1 hypothetical protein [Pseudomonas sp. G1002]
MSMPLNSIQPSSFSLPPAPSGLENGGIRGKRPDDQQAGLLALQQQQKQQEQEKNQLKF